MSDELADAEASGGSRRRLNQQLYITNLIGA
jgi:hypothetical protein